jgi:hypothetical protein
MVRFSNNVIGILNFITFMLSILILGGGIWLAKFLQSSERGLNSMFAVVGSFGYIAPEYTYTLQVNEKKRRIETF